MNGNYPPNYLINTAMITVSRLITYPFKSAKGIALPQATFDNEGMTNDRRLMAINDKGIFLTARNAPRLLGITCTPTENGWELSHADMADTLTITPNHDKILSTKIWGDEVDALDAGAEASNWISEVVQMKAHVGLWHAKSRHSAKYDLETSFADTAPLLIANEASMKQACEWAGIEYDYRRFRPNIVISGVEAFEEEKWASFQIGSATFEMLDTCERCIITTRDPDTNEAHKTQEPLRSLMTHHANASRRPIMGVNAKLINDPKSVVISVNDTVLPQ
ncbi:MOSC domain-containing protein [Leucothrix sargassi]|nr:MOSC domain-containing protein [Leucothrix sargassi]